MNKLIQLNLSVDAENTDEVKKVISFLQRIVGPETIETKEPVVTTATEEVVEPVKKKRTSRKKAVEPEPVEEENGLAPVEKAAAVDPKAEPVKEEVETDDSGLTLQDVKTAVSEKQADHREALKAKLKELGSKSVTLLEQKDYKAMYDLAKSL